MPTEEIRTISLSAEQAAFVDGLVSAGLYGSVSEVVQAGLQALNEAGEVDVDPEDREAYEAWLKAQVMPAYEEAMADPSSTIPAEEVFAEIYALLEARLPKRDARRWGQACARSALSGG